MKQSCAMVATEKAIRAKDFKEECMSKWKHDDQNKLLHAKINDDGCNVHENVNNNAISNEYEHRSKAQQIITNCAGIFFEKGILWIIENNDDFTNDELTREKVKILSEEIIRVTKRIKQ